MKSLIAIFSGVCLFLAAAPLCLCSGAHEKSAQAGTSCCFHQSTAPADEAPCPHCDQAGSLVLDKVPVSDFLNNLVGSNLAPPAAAASTVSFVNWTTEVASFSRTEAPPPNPARQACLCVYRV